MNRNITRSMLLDSFIFGTQIELWARPDKMSPSKFVRGKITSLSAESGFVPTGHLQSFIFTLVDNLCYCYDGYVRTID